jgi:hypothetical protein
LDLFVGMINNIAIDIVRAITPNLLGIDRRITYTSVSQTVVRGPQVDLGFYPCGPLGLNISQKKDRKNKINVNCLSHTVVENLNLLSKGTRVGRSVEHSD